MDGRKERVNLSFYLKPSEYRIIEIRITQLMNYVFDVYRV
jgi:hypothetical protein